MSNYINVIKFLKTLGKHKDVTQCPKCKKPDCFGFYINSSTNNVYFFCSECQLSGDMVDIVSAVKGISNNQAAKQFKPGGRFNSIITQVDQSFTTWIDSRNKEKRVQQALVSYLKECRFALTDTYEGDCALSSVFAATLKEPSKKNLTSCINIGLTTKDIPDALLQFIPKKPSIVFTYTVGKVITHLKFIDILTLKTTDKSLYNITGAYRFNSCINNKQVIIAKNPIIATAIAYKHYIGKSTAIPVISVINNNLPSQCLPSSGIIKILTCISDPTPINDILHWLSKSNTPAKVEVVVIPQTFDRLTWRTLNRSFKDSIPAAEYILKALDILYKNDKTAEIYNLGCTVPISPTARIVLTRTAENLGIPSEIIELLCADSTVNIAKSTSRFTLKVKNHKMYITTKEENWISDFVIDVHATVHCKETGFSGFECTVHSAGFPNVNLLLDIKHTTSSVLLGRAIKKAYMEQHNLSWWEDFTTLPGINWHTIINCLSQNKPLKSIVSTWGVNKNNTLMLPKVSYSLKDKKVYYEEAPLSFIPAGISNLWSQFSISSPTTTAITGLMASKAPEDIITANIICFISEMMAGFLYTNETFPGIDPEYMFLLGSGYNQEEVYRSAMSLFSGTTRIAIAPVQKTGLDNMLKSYKELGSLPLALKLPGDITIAALKTLVSASMPIIAYCTKETAIPVSNNTNTSFMELPNIVNVIPADRLKAISNELAGVFPKYAQERLKTPERHIAAPGLVGRSVFSNLLGINNLGDDFSITKTVKSDHSRIDTLKMLTIS